MVKKTDTFGFSKVQFKNSNLKPEITKFKANYLIDGKENDALASILKANSSKRKEKLIIQNTSRSVLKELLKIPGLRDDIKYRVKSILGDKPNIIRSKPKNRTTIKLEFNREIQKLIKRGRISEKKLNARLSRGIKEITVGTKIISILGDKPNVIRSKPNIIRSKPNIIRSKPKNRATIKLEFNREIQKLIKRGRISEKKLNARLSRGIKEITVGTKIISILGDKPIVIRSKSNIIRSKPNVKSKKIEKEKYNIEKKSNTQKHYNYDLRSLSGHPRFRGSKGKIERKALLGYRRDKVYSSINKYIPFLSGKEKETFTNILFFESVYGKYKDNRGQNRNGTVDIGPCAINNGATYQELKKAGIVRKQSDLYDWDTSFKSAAYLMKRHGVYGFRKWYGRREAKKANLYA